jgi:hypothetical protein
MRRSTILALVCVLAAPSAFAQDKLPTEVAPAPGMVGYFHARLVELSKRLAARPKPDVLAPQGIGAEHDASERSKRLGFVPPALGRAGPLVKGRALALTSDPALTLAAAGSLEARLGRRPTQSEIAAELKAFDTRIAQVNAVLAEQHSARADAYKKQGRIPEAMERAAVAPFVDAGVVKGRGDDPARPSDAPARARRLDWITQQLNQAAAASKKR